MELVKDERELAGNCLRFIALSESASPEEQRYFKERIANAKRFVAMPWGRGYIFVPGAYAAYSGCKTREEWMEIASIKPGNTKSTYRTKGRNHLDKLLSGNMVSSLHTNYATLLDEFASYLQEKGIAPSAHPNAIDFWLIGAEDAEEANHPGEFVESASYTEGAVRQIRVNAYERNAAARRQCIAHYNNTYDCEICGFNFGKAYGKLGNDYIHVHHLRPLSQIQENYQVTPETDLLPVCCNCHAIIHRGRDNLMAPEELRELVLKLKKK